MSDTETAPAPAPKIDVPYEVVNTGSDTLIGYPSNGAILNAVGHIVDNGTMTLTDVGGVEVWLHNQYHHHDHGKVYMPIWVAKDNNLPVPGDETTASDTGGEPTPEPTPTPEPEPPPAEEASTPPVEEDQPAA